MKKWMLLGVLAILAVALLSAPAVYANVISATQADGLIAYQTLNNQTPLYRLWNVSNNLTTVKADSLNVGADISWVVVRANHERDEMVMGVEDKDNDLTIQVYNSTAAAWGALLEVSTDIPNSAHRAFDIAVEDASGDVLIVYENSSLGSNHVLAYRVWNGTGYSGELPLDSTLADSSIHWVQSAPRKGSDEIMVLVHNNAGDLHAALWNGTAFDSVRNLTLSTATTSNAEQHFAFAWEGASDDGLVVYGSGNDLVYRTFSLVAPYWSNEATIALGNGLSAARACSTKNSDHIGLIWIDGGNDVNARMWDGTQILASPPAEDSSAEASGVNSANVDCAWLNSTTALFGFSDVSSGNIGLLSVDYFNFTTPNTWSVSDLTTAPTTMEFASDDIEGLRFAAHPTTYEIIVVGMDVADDISLIRWNGTGFSSIGESPVETNAEVLNGEQEGAMFDWSRYDPVPNVTVLGPNGINYPTNYTLHINASVIDNIKVDTVLANITLPNGTLKQIVLANRTGNSTFYNSTFSITDLVGTYVLRIIANDSSTHYNVNATENVTFTIGDVIAPNVTNITPSGDRFLEGEEVTISANVTDEINESFVFVNVTAPNGSIFRLQMLNRSLAMFNVTFTHTNTLGLYNLRIIANDTTNNINSTETRTFRVGDTIPPNVTNVTPASNPNFALNTIVNITANVTDDVNISNVFANVTFPNGSAILFSMNNLSLRLYNVTFNATRDAGQYNVTIIANDTTNNYNRTEISSFTIGDIFAPNITLVSPSNASNSSSATVTFSFSATDADAQFNCSLILDLIPNATNLTTNSGVDTSFIVNGLAQGGHDWSIRCQDARNNMNTSTRTFNVDTLAPQFVSIFTVPSTAADLDPNRNVTVLANVTENVTDVSIVVLQYKLTNDTEYRNLSMAYNTLDGLYNASFNATQNGTFNLRIFANDTLGNGAYSSVTNVTVQVDRTWARTPLTFTAVIADLNSNVSLGNLTINNTGDVHLQFNITSDSNNTRYNQSALFNLTPGQTLNILVTDVANVSGIKKVTLNISVNDTASEPTSAIVSGNIVVAPGQPVLQSRFTTPSNGARAVQQGAAGVEFVAALNNIGEGNASNLSFFFTIPDSWTITFGSSHSSYDQLNSLESEEKTIRVTIPSNFALGEHTIYVNATGVNGSGYNLSNNNLTFGDRVVVTVESPSAIGGSGGGGSSSSTGSTSTTTAVAASGGSGGSVAKKAFGSVTETIESTEVFSVVRGSGQATPITISNLYENAVMKDIKLDAVGFLGQYVVVSSPIELSGIRDIQLVEGKSEQFPALSDDALHHLTVDTIFGSVLEVTVQSKPQQLMLKKGQSRFVDVNGDGHGDVALNFIGSSGNIADVRLYQVRDLAKTTLAYGERLDYFLDINAPSYLTKSDFELTLLITADIVALNETAAGFERKEITEFRKLLFQVRETGEEDVHLDAAKGMLQEMIRAGFPIGAVQDLLLEAERAVAEGNYELAAEIVARIDEVKTRAFAAHDALLLAQDQITRAREQWLSVPHAEEALQLALVAFEHGDFSTALERAKIAQLQYVLETKGRVNLIYLVVYYWWAIILGVVVSSVLLYHIYKHSIGRIITQRISHLLKEEETLRLLMKEAQEKYLIHKEISAGQYRRYLHNYEQRLTKIQQLRATLRSTQAAILKAKQGLKNIRCEKLEIHELLKKNQTDYFVKGAISRSRFQEIYDAHKMRLAEIEHQEAVLEERLAKENKNAGYPLLAFIQKIVERIQFLFGKKKVEQEKSSEQQQPNFNTISLQKSKPYEQHHVDWKPVVKVHHIVPHVVKHASVQASDWVSVSVPDSVKLNVHCEKTGLELPRKAIRKERAFAEQSRESFDQELLRMARSVEEEPGKEMTYLESLSLHSKPGILSEKELRKWFPGAFEVIPCVNYPLSLYQPSPVQRSSITFDNTLLGLSRYVPKFPLNEELAEMVQEMVRTRKNERREFINSLDFDLLRMLKADHKLKHAEAKQFLNDLDTGLFSLLPVKK